MSKKIYILTLLLLYVNFWSIIPIGYYINDNTSLVLMVFISVYGWKKWQRESCYINFTRYNICVGSIFLAVFLSVVACYFSYYQGVLTSIIASRCMIWYIIIPTLLVIQPSIKELISVLTVYSILYLIIMSLNTFMPIPIIYIKSQQLLENATLEQYDFSKSPEIALRGVILILIPLYYYLAELKKQFSIKILMLSTFFYLIIFIGQNRSTLFIASILYIYCIITSKSKFKFIYCLLIIAFFGVFYNMTQTQFNNLSNKTIENVNNRNYNRNKAYNYFLYKASPNRSCEIFGNGFLSANYTTRMQDMMKKGVYNSDVGFIGVWNQFGIIPIGVFLYFLLSCFFIERLPLFVKLLSIHILICSLTISYFVGSSAMIFFLFVYLYAYYNENIDLLTSEIIINNDEHCIDKL
jgi:hypothetical protein